MNSVWAILAVVGLAIITAVGDYFFKRASMGVHAIQNRWFIAGFITYMLCTFGWVFTMRYLKLGSLGVVYSLSTIILLAVLGTLVFGETMNRFEIIGFGFAVAAIVLLGRFA